MLKKCTLLGKLEEGKIVHTHLLNSHFSRDSVLLTTLINLYSKCGSLDDARQLFDEMPDKRDIVAWTALIDMYAKSGSLEEAKKVFDRLLRRDVVSWNTLLKGYAQHGLGKAALMHKKTELGIYAAERIFELDPHDSGPHMLLYNIYASAGRWAEATKVRKIMKESGVKKEPACSWVEIENEVHVFVADDDSHPDSEEIHAMWENTRLKIKQIGYKPDANHVLLCLDQREREVKLQHHSEKLALAFALLKTPPRSTIRIKKNIRVCGDCHSAFKLVSKVVNREIIVRDTNRFHHFRKGSCSCRDYW
ncbi:Pentatricopeptide repeat-containing protein At3g24000, mitochondrial [Linum perenne]